MQADTQQHENMYFSEPVPGVFGLLNGCAAIPPLPMATGPGSSGRTAPPLAVCSGGALTSGHPSIPGMASLSNCAALPMKGPNRHATQISGMTVKHL